MTRKDKGQKTSLCLKMSLNKHKKRLNTHEGVELKQRRWHYVFSFLNSQKKQIQTKTDYLKVTQFKTENLYHISDVSSELFNHFHMYLIVQTFIGTFQVPVFITLNSNCNHIHSYAWLPIFDLVVTDALLIFLKSTFNFHSLLLPKVFVVVFHTCMCTLSIKSTVITCTLVWMPIFYFTGFFKLINNS